MNFHTMVKKNKLSLYPTQANLKNLMLGERNLTEEAPRYTHPCTKMGQLDLCVENGVKNKNDF
jgi:hypothetical protein